MKAPKYSAIVPCYNGFDDLDSLVETLLSISSDLLEVVIVDDGSETDYSRALPSNFYLYKKDNGGVSSARNYGLDRATGEYVFFLDCDDQVDPDFIDVINSEVAGNKSQVYLFSHNFVSGDKIYAKKNRSLMDAPSKLVLKKVFNKQILFHNGAVVYSRGFLKEHDLCYSCDLKYSEDVIFILSALSKAKAVTVSHKSFYNYIDNDNSVINKSFGPTFLDHLSAFYKLEKMAVSSELEKDLSRFIFSCVIHVIFRAVMGKGKDVEVFSIFLDYARKCEYKWPGFINKYSLFLVVSKSVLFLPSSLMIALYKAVK
ncbi:glycosyltransferase family 2 protein [Oceanimonas marisflavi]|uniref:glycosyltransferase family 2 protein n=1 Tax=Oceanimonas marisflavi TaxID=2059724 RepID=UPI000D2F8CD1|nr:glycosyltransferase [Oceanimonas marisflavi]